MTLVELAAKFPIDSEFFTVFKGRTKMWVETHTVYGYRTVNDELFLLTVTTPSGLEEYNINDCFSTKAEAKATLPPQAFTVKVAVDAHGREIECAVFDDDSVIEVSPDYGVHVGHCCVIHGCKYGNPDCPVINAQILQKYLCEECNSHFGDKSSWIEIMKRFGELKGMTKNGYFDKRGN